MPPFPAIRAFEAAARHLSFKRAAGELHVTQSAISHQVKALEDYLGAPLFRRTPHGVTLTDAGEAYLPVLGDALDRIADGTQRLRASRASGQLTVRTTPAFAARWLVPRLNGFRDACPDIDVRLMTSVAPVDFAREDIDIAIYYGRGDWPGLRADLLVRSRLIPVCSPRLLAGRYPLRKPADLRRHTILHSEYGEDWARWMAVAGIDCVDLARGPRFEDCNLLLGAAVEGQGVALAFEALARTDLAAGRLVSLFDVRLATDAWYYALTPEAWAVRPKIAAFRDWLLAEASGDAAIPTPRRERIRLVEPVG